ncbi:MAG TPA: DEAD/DEAH box helicase [Vicinamibacteria bacterium]|nr:DEAD/DEAH box helicase [Vicinamibacteria bacterium]
MIVAHGTWLPESSRFFLWAETTSADSQPAHDGDHPFQLARDRLEAELLRPLVSGSPPEDSMADSMPLIVPSVEGSPVASPELHWEDRPRATRLAPWVVHGLTLSPESALTWLVTLPAPEELDPHVLRVGADIRFWCAAARFTLELLARQRFLPGVVGARSFWEPLVEEDADRLDALRSAMPPACWLMLNADPDALLRGFVRTLVDHFVRRAASRLRMRPRFVETAGEELAGSLFARNGRFESDDAEALAEELESWQARAEEVADSPFRIAFRLDPPADRESWSLRFFLQAVDDESVLVPVGRIWKHGGASWRHLERYLARPQEMVLEGLGRAASLFPPLEDSLRHPRPESCSLDVDDAYRFLTEAAFLLRDSGFGVLLPSWWGKRGHGLGLSLRVQPSASSPRNVVSRLGLDSLVEFDWRVALGEDTLSREEFLELADLKRPLVRVRGQWVELTPQRVEDVLSALQSKPALPEMSLGDVVAMKLGRRGDGSLPVTELNASGFLDELLSRLSGRERLPDLETPRFFRGELRPYQKLGLSWLGFLSRWGLGVCLADDMGLGKTIQVLALLLHLKERSELDQPFLLICPTSVAGNWRKEAERFAPELTVLIHHGIARTEGETFRSEAEKHDLVVSTYSLVHRDLERLGAVAWGGIVLDEAQNIKNPQAKQTRAVRKLAAKKRIALTGTPVENRLQELWSIMEFLNPGYLGSEASFRRRYALPIERYRDAAATAELRRLVEPFVLRRVKTDPAVIRDLPEKNEMKVYCTLTPEQATLYQAVVQESLERIEAAENGIGRKGQVLAALTRLKQICNHPAHFLSDGSSLSSRSGKLTRLTEMLEEVLAEEDRALIFTQYAEMGKLIRRHLAEQLSIEVLFLHGGVPAAMREKMIATFQDGSAAPIFVLSLKAGGFGLNLTEARHVFHFDRWWNPAVEDQATDRAFRIGQTRSVSVYKFICAGTVEERVDAMAERKKELAETVVQPGEGFLTELSNESLRDLFDLRREAIGD